MPHYASRICSQGSAVGESSRRSARSVTAIRHTSLSSQTFLLIGATVQQKVDIRVSEDVPVYSTTVDSSLVPLGRIPLGGGGPGFDPRPASEGGCTAGPFEGCHIYNIKVNRF